jgi:hypothetical protein
VADITSIDPLLTPEEAYADPAIRLNPGTAANMRMRGEGPAYIKRGRLVFYKRSDLLAYINSKRVTTRDAA